MNDLNEIDPTQYSAVFDTRTTYMKFKFYVFFFQAEDGIRDLTVTGVQTCALPICWRHRPRQSLGPARARHDGPPNLGQPEARVGRRDAQITGQRLLEATGQTEAVDGGDHRLPDRKAARDAAQAEARVRDRVVATAAPEGARDHLLQIGTGRERLVAGAGQD